MINDFTENALMMGLEKARLYLVRHEMEQGNYHYCNSWNNTCGHIDDDVIKEASTLKHTSFLIGRING